MVFKAFHLDAVNRAVTTLDGAAGKSLNVAKVLKALGEDPLATGFLGGDRGAELAGILSGLDVPAEFVRVNARTRQCITILDQSSGQHTELVEESAAITAEEFDQLERIVNGRIPESRAVVMSGTLAPGVPQDFYARCVRKAHSAGVLSVVDAQGPPLLDCLTARPGLVKPNRSELSATVGRSLPSEEDLVGAMGELHERGAERIVVTAGKDPTLAFDGQRVWRVTAPRIRAVNPIGSGDSFTAALTSRLVRGDDLGEACRWAAAAGTANALTLMAGEVDPAEVSRLLGDVRVELV
jgi:tagatose 6-phosphate kinase